MTNTCSVVCRRLALAGLLAVSIASIVWLLLGESMRWEVANTWLHTAQALLIVAPVMLHWEKRGDLPMFLGSIGFTWVIWFSVILLLGFALPFLYSFLG